ncbi:MAG: hypothetical protein M3428_02510 [Pseudomonadota bacterium]|nr:hypothetical protein [Pseudomonadota bacterium]
MKKMLILAGIAALVSAGPAMADPKKGKGMRGHDIDRNGVPDYRQRGFADLNGNGILDYRERRLVDLNRNGLADWRERWIDVNNNGLDDRREGFGYSGNRHGGAACPPGLAKKNPACVPPGQANRLFREGQRVGAGYRYYTPYGDIPIAYRNQYFLDDDYRYIYRNNYIYEVDPTTSLVRRIISLFL